MKKEYLKWVEIAEKDLLTAKTMIDIDTPPLEIICYHCEQAAEKYLKAYLIYNDEPIAKTHDLVFLNKKCIKQDKDFEKITKECIRLTNYGVNIRYPNFMDIIREDAEIALKDVMKIIDLINKKIK
jgi:HEPN domain-containing protein